MTSHAREVLGDCHVALELLDDETDLIRWRIHWVAAVVLVRAVGHVLDKIDGAADARVQTAADNAYRRWKGDTPEHEIFREFIERERNNILKEYAFAIHPSDEVQVVVETTLQAVDGGQQMTVAHVLPLGENLYRPVLDGYGEAEDGRDVLREAIKWWDTELSKIESVISENLAR